MTTLNEYMNDELTAENRKQVIDDVYQLITSDKATPTDLWEAFELDSVNSTMLEAISNNPLAPTDLLNAIGRELISRSVQDIDLMQFDDEATENVLNHENTSETMKEEVREYVVRSNDG